MNTIENHTHMVPRRRSYLPRRLTFTLVAASALIGLAACGSGSGGTQSSTGSGTTTITMGTEPWLGYGPWYIAQQEGYFAKNHLNVHIQSFEQDAELDSAFASGKVQVANIATNTLLQLAARNIKLQAVQLLDESLTADAILAPKSITSVQQLKGKTVAYEQGTTSDILLHHALQQYGMTTKDIKVVPMAAANVGAALLAKKVQVGVTYQPYISAVTGASNNFHLLYSAGEDPGLISDVTVAQPAYIKSHPAVMKELVESWKEAVAFYNTHKGTAQAIIAKNVGASTKSLASSFAGVRLYTAAEAKQQLTGPYVTTALPDVLKAAQAADLVKGSVSNLGALVDATFVKEVG